LAAAAENEMNDFKKQIVDARKNVALVSSFGRGGNLLDLGANIGEVAIRCASHFDRVFAVEAHPDTFSVLAKRVLDAGVSSKVELINAAVASKSGLTYFISSPSFCATGSTARATPRLKTKPANYYREVPTIGLAELLESSQPRVVKMDIESCEIECLDNDRLVVPDCVRNMVVEFHGLSNDTTRQRTRAIVERMAGQGLALTNPRSFDFEKRPAWSLATFVFGRTF
jgi:FkbM family methyltransferase